MFKVILCFAVVFHFFYPYSLWSCLPLPKIAIITVSEVSEVQRSTGILSGATYDFFQVSYEHIFDRYIYDRDIQLKFVYSIEPRSFEPEQIKKFGKRSVSFSLPSRVISTMKFCRFPIRLWLDLSYCVNFGRPSGAKRKISDIATIEEEKKRDWRLFHMSSRDKKSILKFKPDKGSVKMIGG